MAQGTRQKAQSVDLVSKLPEPNPTEHLWVFPEQVRSVGARSWIEGATVPSGVVYASSGIHVNARTQGFPAECCIVRRWPMLFPKLVSGFNFLVDRCTWAMRLEWLSESSTPSENFPHLQLQQVQACWRKGSGLAAGVAHTTLPT